MKKQKDKSSFKLAPYFAKHKFKIFMYCLLTILGGGATVFYTLLSAKAIEYLALGDTRNTIYIFLISLGIAFGQRIIWHFSNLLSAQFSTKITSALNFTLAKQAFKLSSETYSHHSTGVFTQRVINDPRQFTSQFSGLISSIVSLLSTLAVLLYIICISPWLGLAIISLLAICMVVDYFKNKQREKDSKKHLSAFEEVNSLTTEIIKSEKDIKSTGLENAISKICNEKYSKLEKAKYSFSRNGTYFWSLRFLILDLGCLAILILGIHLMDLGLLTFATFMVFYSRNGTISSFASRFGSIRELITDMKISYERMATLFDEDEFKTEKFGDVHKDFVKGKIEFKNVSYAYKEYERTKKTKTEPSQWKKINENKIFEDISFKIKPNTTVAFVGKSGSGKSTILNLLSKMYEVDSGEILIDNVNINDFDKETLRSTISLVNQFPYIFDMSIKENLILAKPDASDDELWDAISKASLEEFVKSLPKGIDTIVGEGGIKLSGGQKQRLAIARALLRATSIIIFDESTSSLDNFAQNDIKKTIDGLKGKSTIIIVAHRLSTIKDVDKIFFLENGKIVDSGTFEKLFNKNKTFKAMFLTENV